MFAVLDWLSSNTPVRSACMANARPIPAFRRLFDDKLLWVYCCDCGHERDVNPSTVPLPADTAVPDVGKHMKCSVCGSRKINTKLSCTRAV